MSNQVKNWMQHLVLLLLLSACASKGGPNGWSDASLAEPLDIKVTYSSAKPETKLACQNGNREPECSLITYQIMVESFIDGDPDIVLVQVMARVIMRGICKALLILWTI